MVLGVGKGVLLEVPSVQEWPHRERERFHCTHTLVFFVNIRTLCVCVCVCVCVINPSLSPGGGGDPRETGQTG